MKSSMIKKILGCFKANKAIFVSAFVVLLGSSALAFFQINQPDITTDESIKNASSLFSQGKEDEAISLLESAYAKDKADQSLAKKLADYYFQTNNYDRFVTIADEANLVDADTYVMRAYICRESGDQSKAIEYYTKAIAINPKSTSTYVTFANYYSVLGQIDQALLIIQSGLSGNPKSSTLNLLAANYSLKLSDKVGAKKYARAVLEVNASNIQAQDIIDSQ